MVMNFWISTVSFLCPDPRPRNPMNRIPSTLWDIFHYDFSYKNVNVTRTCICDKLVTKLNWTMFLNKSQRNLPRNTNIFKGTSVTYHMMFILFDFLCKKSLHVFLVMYWSLIWLFRFNFSWLNVCGLCFLVRISADLRTEETTAVDHRRRFKAHSTTNEY